jgi:hypothetical protein
MKFQDLIKAIDEQFEKFDQALASTLFVKFSTTKFIYLNGVSEHIMRKRENRFIDQNKVKRFSICRNCPSQCLQPVT